MSYYGTKGLFKTELWDLDCVDRPEKQAICPNPVIQYRNCQSWEGMEATARAELELEPWLPNTNLSAFSKLSCYKPSAGWQWGWSISVSHTSSGVSPHLRLPLMYLGTTASLSLGLVIFSHKSWPVCPFSNDILRSDPGPTHTHTHTNLATERPLQFYEFQPTLIF